ncbi:ankyrin repeat domain-containing protein [Paenibacillus sp. M1]|uniref:Ankyrin repeat domain-containing protein n=1 Tax=Paenibacillus haidiansis TaxID=1574488 RepID=A0ABU7VWK2_9BACL
MELKEIINEMLDAIDEEDIKKVTQAVNKHENLIMVQTPFGTLLHYASSEGKLEMVKHLIALGSDVNRHGGTFDSGAINYAASEGHIEIVKYLLSVGAELDVSEPQRNPLFAAIHKGHVEIAKLLIRSGIDTTVSYTGETMKDMNALAFAKEWGQMEIAALLEGSSK